MYLTVNDHTFWVIQDILDYWRKHYERRLRSWTRLFIKLATPADHNFKCDFLAYLRRLKGPARRCKTCYWDRKPNFVCGACWSKTEPLTGVPKQRFSDWRDARLNQQQLQYQLRQERMALNAMLSKCLKDSKKELDELFNDKV